MRFALAGGGTGGHVYPALSVAAALRRRLPAATFTYLGTAAGAERRLVPASGLDFHAVPAGQVRGKSPARVFQSMAQLAWGVRESRRILAAFQPQAVFATGGYASVPVVIAARLSHLPLIVFLPDIYPGWAVRLAARLATQVATSSEAALAHLPGGRGVVTGYPLRQEFQRAERAEGRRRFGLGAGPVVLISGASSGSVALNDAVLTNLERLLDRCELLHLTGVRDTARAQEAQDRLSPARRSRYHVFGYLEEIAWAMAAADLAVLRAGASSLAEPPAVALPAILVPGPFSDQRRNAEYMQAQGAALMLEQDRLPTLADQVQGLLSTPARLEAMAAAARRLAHPCASETLAALLIEATTGAAGEKAGIR